MSKSRLTGLALLAASLLAPLHAANYADFVVEYEHGTGFATDFSTGDGYTNATVALGAPSVDTGFAPVTPFNPEFSIDHLVSIGTGGTLTLGFSSPILNDPANRFGLDFIIFGSTGFIDVDFPNGLTDGSASTFGHNPGANPGTTRVWISVDNIDYFELDPTRAPVVDGFWPADSAGDFSIPVDPTLGPVDVADQSLENIRALYEGSGGGTAYDIAWALDDEGNSVFLSEANYIRIDVLQDRSEIDAIAAVTPVPEPGVWALLALGGAITVMSIRRSHRHSTSKP